MNFKLKSALVLISGLYANSALALEPFVVKDIRVEGIQRTEAGTVFTYLPVKVGETMNDELASQAIKSLYNTGFFKDVRIEAENDVLVVTVQERSSIAQIDFSGNKSFPTDKMKEGLKQIGIAEGLIFDKSQLDRAEQEVKRQYLSQGKYGATVKAVVSPLERNRVAVRFDIEEGAVSKIRNINIVGNQTFSTDDLRAEFLLTTPNWMSWWNKDDQYSKQKLNADLETLRSFYLNQGYLEFNIDSTQVSISPDKKDIYITVNVTEGEKYTISEVKIAGETIVSDEEIQQLITIKKGDTFSREKVTQSSKAISDRLSNDGYAFSNVNPVPEVNKEQHTAAFTFFVDPGKRVYVRRINIAGNTRTRDEVVRREVRQLESSWYASNKINRSKERLIRTDFFSDVNVETPGVPGTTDQVDLNISVTEKSTGSIQFGAGLSSNEGVVLGITVNQNNFLGTGNRVSAQVNTGKVNTTYSLSVTDPYFTPDGVSRGFDVYRRDVNTSSLNVASYNTSSYGGGVRFGIPLNERDGINFGLAADFTTVDLNTQSPTQYQKFCGNTTGCSSNSVVASAGWAHDTRDNIMFTTNGVLQKLSGEISLPILDLNYYKIDYKQAWFKNVYKDFTFMLNGEIGYADSYGNKNYPFFKNYFMGGVNSVRGYDNGSLGPKDIDPITGQDFAVGGTKRLLGNAELFFPVPGLKDSKQFRLSAFVDGGNVWGTESGYSLSDLRYSAGVGISWLSPFGPLKLVFAKPLNSKDGDNTQNLQFQLGSQF
ncbi:outer membrane protein assembly factor BamA [Methylotenera sp.]|uniref:outer membrane protein assembly factor BamA n=2 Tax=Methylotenera sp. TaxID=2051956 RepID=UPI002728A376|nr:outer membrane protein assembly factor BamA [Methylotenera sp.]MDO9204666.1 outer membrane protein assembly factor BamA [Methylotenera sp.]MDP2071523.1 outer membrane protein assembly factor BamA [Methylotenera sp.]MDP3004954.1 outer membrane protein assembly factor BamA [Methylotenera sp.]MDP3307136.1 outer membrane protein assembly factor BamA [Methylotenera sp.]